MFSVECSRLSVTNEVQKNDLDLSVYSLVLLTFFNKDFKVKQGFLLKAVSGSTTSSGV